jgi:hypothetical protein|nr:MAG TPA: tail completion protein [Caudoviricetes sp.]
MKDVVSDLIDRLGLILDVPVATDRPVGVDTCVTLNRQGGRYQNALLDKAGIGIYCWATSEYEASSLAREVADIVGRLNFSDGYASVEMESMRSDPDPDLRTPRWYLSYTITNY